MRYGGYDLRKASKSKSPSSHGSLRLKKVQNTACNIVGRFNLKITDSLKRLNLQRSAGICESPVSFRGSLFEHHCSAGSYRATPSTLNDIERRSTTDDSQTSQTANNLVPNYIFGTNLCNFSAHNLLNGKSTIKIINTFKELEAQQRGTSDSAVVTNSLERLRNDRKTIFKELIELSSCDESLEYRLVKDYLEYNTYSEIENDSEFKEYLQRKNYNDILDYLDDVQPKSLTSISSSVARAQSALSKHTLSRAKHLATPKALHFTKSDTWKFKEKLCNSCRTSVDCNEALKWSSSCGPTTTTTTTTTSNNLTNESTTEPDTISPAEDLHNGEKEFFANSYSEILKFCQEFFAESLQKKSGFDLPKFNAQSKFKQTNYERVLREFVGAQGFVSVDAYVETKFGQFFNIEFGRKKEEEEGDSDQRRANGNVGYRDQMLSEEMMHLVPASLQGKEDILFGNLHELYTFHNDIFLKDLENCISTTELVALCFVQRRDTFYRLYSFYCQNIPRSDRLRETLVDTHLFLQECQKRLGHKLPLGAYLLKPVQRITKYKLLLENLLGSSDSGSCTKELQKALDCMLIVLRCVNDSMHQVAITGFPSNLSQQGELLLQDPFQVWTESKKDLRLRKKPQQRHIFLYQKSMIFCKKTSKPGHNKSTYQFKHQLKMSQIGLTESVRGDSTRFEVWLQGRQEVHTLQATTDEVKNKWVTEIKRLLLNQLEELKGEKIKQYSMNHHGLRQTTSWDTPNILLGMTQRAVSCDASSESSNRNSNCSSSGDDAYPHGMPLTAGNGHAHGNGSIGGGSGGVGADKDQQEACGWSSDYSNSEDEMSIIEDNSAPGSKFVALADYTAMGHSEVSMREGGTVELLKVGCAGWWFVRDLEANTEGWTPAAYLEPLNRKSSRSSSRNQERINLNKFAD